VSESVLLVLAGGLVGILASAVPVILQRSLAAADRRRAHDAQALDSAVRKLMAWQDYAALTLSRGNTAAVQERLAESDLEWEADLTLIPDQEATQALVTMVREVYFFGGVYRDDPDVMERSGLMMNLLDRVIASARKKRRELA
jgi:hypothetical protein